LVWLSNNELRVPVWECPLDARCTGSEGGYAERTFAVSGEGLRPR